MSSPRSPNTPPHPLTFTPADLRLWTEELVRIAPTASRHTVAFGELRTFGPLAGQRWDPHPPGPPRHHPHRWGVLYAASTVLAACAETGQRTRTIDRVSGSPALLIWTPTRPLQLLDLTSDSTFLIRNRAAAALTTRPTAHCQTWAHHIVRSAHVPPIDGLLVPSPWTGTNIVLFGASSDSFPTTPSTRASLSDPPLFPMLTTIAHRIGFTLI